MLGLYPLGTRPLGALRRQSGAGPAYGVLTVAGAAVLAATILAQSRMVLATSGVGALGSISGPASGSLAASGAGVLSGSLTARGAMAVTSAGIGSMSGAFSAVARFAASLSGAGACAPILRASVSSSTLMQGWATMGSSDSPGSGASFVGLGSMLAVAYAFFDDAEKAGPVEELRVAYVLSDPSRFLEPTPATVHNEIRVVFADPEYRVAVVPAEDRVYEVSAPDEPPSARNRRRTL